MRDFDPLLSTTHLLNRDLFSAQGELIGRIVDFVVEINRAELAYAIAQLSGPRPPSPPAYHAIPIGQLVLDRLQERFVVERESEDFGQAPVYEVNEAPSPEHLARVRDFYSGKESA